LPKSAAAGLLFYLSLGRDLKERALVISHWSLGRGEKMRRRMTDDGRRKTDNREKKSNGRGDPAPTLTMRIYNAFETIRHLFISVKVGPRFPRPLPGNIGQDKENQP
jgi:hypothetical protein